MDVPHMVHTTHGGDFIQPVSSCEETFLTQGMALTQWEESPVSVSVSSVVINRQLVI